RGAPGEFDRTRISGPSGADLRLGGPAARVDHALNRGARPGDRQRRYGALWPRCGSSNDLQLRHSSRIPGALTMTGDSIRRVIDGVTVAAALAVVAVLGTGWARRALAHHADASAAASAPSDRSAAPDSSEPLPSG